MEAYITFARCRAALAFAPVWRLAHQLVTRTHVPRTQPARQAGWAGDDRTATTRSTPRAEAAGRTSRRDAAAAAIMEQLQLDALAKTGQQKVKKADVVETLVAPGGGESLVKRAGGRS